MVLDLAETPKLGTLSVNGRLSFIQHEDYPSVHLQAHAVFVRAGELLIGSEEEPFAGNATITLLGETEDDGLTLQGTVTGGNKVLAVTGDVKIFGTKRQTQMLRLLRSVYKGDESIVVDAENDWVPGDLIYLAPTTMMTHHNEYRTIVAKEGAKLTLDAPLEYYHYGDGSSTGRDYEGVDMRGEVLLLTRNVKIQGERRDGWGGQIVVTDMFETDGNWRKGSLIMDSVQVYNCSQKDMWHAAIRWEGAIGGHSRVSNSAIHHGKDWGVMAWQTNNVELIDNTIVGFRQFGMNLDLNRNCTITGNFIGGVEDRGIAFIDKTVDKEACVAYGSFNNDAGNPSYEMTFMNNIAAGCPYAGFVAPGHACGDTDQVSFRDNVAHSIGRMGAYVYPNPAIAGSAKCFEASHAVAYKVQETCFQAYADTDELRAHHVTCIDNKMGASLITAARERDEVEIFFYDSLIMGNAPALDCPPGDRSECYCKHKFGFMTGVNMNDGKGLHPTSASALPIWNSHGEGNWGGRVNVERVTFKGFLGATPCGMRNVAFERGPTQSDKIPPHFFDNCKFEDVTDEGMGFLEKPNPAWANIKDCANFPCTAPNNLILTFTNTKFAGVQPSAAAPAFTVVPDDETIGGTYSPCKHMPAMQVYICQVRNIGMLMMESLDEDAWDRSIVPI